MGRHARRCRRLRRGLCHRRVDLGDGCAERTRGQRCVAGGGSQADEVVADLEVTLSDPKVKSLLVNIFGGITRCDGVAKCLLTALDSLGATLPIVVRLDGTNEDEGRKIIAEQAPDNVVVEQTMLSAAQRAVDLANEAA